jgi:hypothetical protein
MRPYNSTQKTPTRCRVAGHPRDCAICGNARPIRLGSRKAPRQAARLVIKAA